MLRPRVIINADELGLNPWSNDRVLEAFDRGWISNAAIVVNTPAFEDAARRVNAAGLQDRIGLHAMLDEGEPLSQAMYDARLGAAVQRKNVPTNPAITMAIGDEIREQIYAARQAGLPITHFNSHNNRHTQWAALSQVIPACLDEDVLSVQLAGNMLFPTAMQKRVYRFMVNKRIRTAGFITTQKFTYLNRFLAAEPNVDDSLVLELSVRPGVDEEFRLFQSEAFRRLLDRFELITYADLQRSQISFSAQALDAPGA